MTRVPSVPVHTLPDAVRIGQAENFQTDDPLYTCLNGSSIDLWLAPAEFPGQTGSTGSAPRAVTVANCGGGVLELAGATVGGPASGDYSLDDECAGQSLPAAASCTIDVVNARVADLVGNGEFPGPAITLIVV